MQYSNVVKMSKLSQLKLERYIAVQEKLDAASTALAAARSKLAASTVPTAAGVAAAAIPPASSTHSYVDALLELAGLAHVHDIPPSPYKLKAEAQLAVMTARVLALEMKLKARPGAPPASYCSR